MKNRSPLIGFCLLSLAISILHAQEVIARSPPSIPEERSKEISSLARSYYNLGKELYSANNCSAAIEYFEKALDMHPKWGEALYYNGICHSGKTDYKSGALNMMAAIQDPGLGDKERAWAYIIIGHDSIFNKRQFDEAESSYMRARLIDPLNVEAYNALAYLYANQGINLDKALKFSNHAVSKSESRFYKLYYLDTRGWIYYKKGTYDKAERDVLRSLKIAKEYGLPVDDFDNITLSELHYHLGMIYLAQNKRTEAMRSIDKSLEFNSKNNDAIRIRMEYPNGQ